MSFETVNLKEQKINRAEILEYFRYEAESGKLFWLKFAGGNSRVGSEAGFDNGTGHKAVTLKGEKLQIAKVVYFLEAGIYPRYPVGKKDGVPANNKFSNLIYRPASKNEITRDLILNCIKYDKETGCIFWLATGKKVYASGKPLECTVFGFKVRKSALIWLIETGEWRESEELMYLDGNTKNCGYENLAIPALGEMRQSNVLYENNTTGRRGVYYHKGMKKWNAKLNVCKETFTSKWCETFDEASKCRTELELMHFTGRRLKILELA